MRVMVEKGLYIQPVNAAVIAGYIDYDVPHFLAFQLLDENGRPAQGSYLGEGRVVERGNRKHLILGDPYKSAQLPEYEISATPESSSNQNVDDFVEGLRTALERRKTKRNANSVWREGFAEGKKLLKKR